MLKAKVVSIQNDQVKLALEDGQFLVVPLAAVEGVPTEGAEVAVIVAALGSEDAGRQAMARHLLNNLLAE